MTRPQFHLTPERGFLGDPNGVVHIDGRHHVFYQWNPAATAFGRMHWGHAVSTDLLSWEHRPAALVPGADGPTDAAGCWSGGAAVTATGEVEFFYTAVTDGPDNVQRPRLAVPTDRTFDVLRPDAVLATPPDQRIRDFRDPFVWWDGSVRRMVLAAVLPSAEPALLSYVETPSGWVFEATLGRDVLDGVPGRLWECPSVIRLADRWVVLLSVVEGEGSAEKLSVWGVTLDQAPGPQARPLWVGRLDAGDRYYAALPWQHADGRWLQVGWLRTQDDPTVGSHDWTGAMSVPRELRLIGDRVVFGPADELAALTRTPLPDGPDPAGEPALEVIVETTRAGRLLLSGANHRIEVPVGDLVDDRGLVRVFVDAGLVEAFGPAGVHSDTSWLLERVVEVSTSGDASIVQVARLRVPPPA